MKFASALKFNAVSEWWDEYIAYDALKKQIYQFEKRQHAILIASSGSLPVYRNNPDLEVGDSEREALLQSSELVDPSATDGAFSTLLDAELKKICVFYEQQEKEVLNQLAELEEQIKEQEEAGLEDYADRDWGDDDDDGDDDQESEEGSRRPTKRQRRRTLSFGHGHGGSRFGTGKANRLASYQHSTNRDNSVSSAVIPEETSRSRERRLSVSSGSSHELELSQSSLHPPTSSNRPHKLALDTSISSLRHSGTPARNPSRSPISRITTKFASLRNSILSDGTSPASEQDHGPNVWQSKSSYAWDTRLLFKRRITRVYIDVTNLRSYVEVNWSGFRKILKKLVSCDTLDLFSHYSFLFALRYDKVTDSKLKESYLSNQVSTALPFTDPSRLRLSSALDRLKELYAKCVTRGDKKLAGQQLKLHQRENIAWERDTVWRQMLGRERRGQGSRTAGMHIGLGGGVVVTSSEEEGGIVDVPIPRMGKWTITKKEVSMLIAVVTFVVLLNVPAVEGEEASRCMAVLVFATIMWATEVSLQ